MSEAPAAYPLAWPAGRRRTSHGGREHGKFGSVADRQSANRTTRPLTVAEARARLEREMNLLGAALVVLSSNLELRLDGQPRSGRPEPADPGVAVHIRLGGRPMVLACDRFHQVAQNIAAVAGHVEATRRIERYGVASVEEMFAAFEALPGPAAPDDWRALLGHPASLAMAEAAYRARIRRAHPDAGGRAADAAALNAAIERAREAFGPASESHRKGTSA